MAERYGGKYSPEGSPNNAPPPLSAPGAGRPTGFEGQRPARAGLKTNLLFVLPLPLAVRAFAMGAGGLVMTLAGLGLMLLSAWLTREGEKAHQEWDSRKVARRPAFPRKIAGSIVMGAGLLVASLPDAGIFAGAALGILGAVLHLFAFGPDPLSDKGMEGIDAYSQDRAARAVDKAEAYLKEMSDAILRAGDRKLEARVAAFQVTARKMFRNVEEDPRDLVAAKKYLTVYLMGARDATAKFADLYAQGHDPKARSDYESLLDDLETSFARQTEALMDDDRTDLDVEIDVLRERLEREGIRAG